jgi:hypothetical protein
MTSPRRSVAVVATALTAALAAALAAVTLTAAPAVADPPVPTQLAASVDAAEVVAGQQVVVSGRLTKDPGTGPVGVPGSTIGIRSCADPACSTAWGSTSTTTGPDGYFQVSYAPPRTGHLRAYFTPAWPQQADLLGSSAVTPQVGVLQVTDNSAISVTRQADGQVGFYGTIGFPSRVLPPTAPVLRVEFSPDAVTWATVDTVTSHYFHNAYYVYTSYVAEPGSGYWRAVFDGQPGAAAAASTGVKYVA